MGESELYLKRRGYSPCLSVGGGALGSANCRQSVRWLKALSRWVELRFDLMQGGTDYCGATVRNVVKDFSYFSHRIAVCHRQKGGFGADVRRNVIGQAIAAGCDAVDIDWFEERDYPSAFHAEMVRRAVKRIRSLHLSRPLASPRALRNIIARMRRGNPFLVKVVVPCRSLAQARLVLSCYDGREDLLLIASGPKGRASRVKATVCGAPFSYVHLGMPTGSGQLSWKQYRRAFRYWGDGD